MNHRTGGRPGRSVLGRTPAVLGDELGSALERVVPTSADADGPLVLKVAVRTAPTFQQ